MFLALSCVIFKLLLPQRPIVKLYEASFLQRETNLGAYVCQRQSAQAALTLVFKLQQGIFPEDCPVYLDAWKPALWLQKLRSHQGYFFFLLIAPVLD